MITPGENVALRKDLRKSLGSYYTPETLAVTLTQWAIRSPADRVLDPSFGGCVFLDAAVKVLYELGSQSPARLVFGVDIDPATVRYAGPILRCGADRSQFVSADFLELQPEGLTKELFDVVAGNPPYVRHHRLKGQVRQTANLVSKSSGIKIAGRASYWAYFLAHSLRFLAPEGRLALVLPGTFLRAEYAAGLRRELVKRFRRVLVILLHERVFKDSQEESLILLAEGYGSDPEYAGIATVDAIENLNGTITNQSLTTTPISLSANNGNWLKSILSKPVADLYDSLSQSPMVTVLGELGKVRIGAVTGANHFFVLTSDLRRELQVGAPWVQPVVGRSSFLQGLIFTEADWSSVAALKGARVFLIDTGCKTDYPPSLGKYLEQGRKLGIHRAYKCRNRNPWHTVPIGAPPDAFLQYMAALQPRLVLNWFHAVCTNSVHIVNWTKPLSRQMAASVALSFLSTLSRLSAELVGRSYGGGVLKLEPSEAARVRLVFPEKGFRNSIELVKDIDKLLKRGRTEEARYEADKVVLADYMGMSAKELQTLREEVSRLVRRRWGKKRV